MAKQNVARSAGIVSAAVLTSRLSGLIRETVMAHLFGAGRVYDAFSLGFRIPNLTRDLFAEGALSSAFVPTFTEYLVKDRREAVRLSNLVGTALLVIVGLVTVAGMTFTPWLVALLAPGWEVADPGKFALAIQLTRIMFPFLLMVAMAAQAMGVLNACNRFGIPATASTLFNLGSVAFGIAAMWSVGPRLGLPPIESMAYGIVAGGVMQLLWQVPSLVKLGFGFRPAWNWSHPGLRHIATLMLPAIIGSAAVQVNAMVNTNFASTIVDPVRGVNGPVSWLGYAFRFLQFPLGVFGVAIASATLPSLSRSAFTGDLDGFRRMIARALGSTMLLTLPATAGLIILGGKMIGLVYQGRKFEAYDTHQTALALSGYAIGLAAYASLKVLAPAFYALGNARIPMLVSLASVALNYFAAWSMVTRAHWGHAGLALATSLVAVAGALALFWLLRERLGGIHGRALVRTALKVTLACAGMVAVVLPVTDAIERWLGMNRLARAIDLGISIPLGAAVYIAIAYWLRVAELETAARALHLPDTAVARFKRDRIEKKWLQT
ncbi:MAG: murein biosynthesis integral membrane protein MurJ [Bryobacteraceae bacterium]